MGFFGGGGSPPPQIVETPAPPVVEESQASKKLREWNERAGIKAGGRKASILVQAIDEENPEVGAGGFFQYPGSTGAETEAGRKAMRAKLG